MINYQYYMTEIIYSLIVTFFPVMLALFIFNFFRILFAKSVFGSKLSRWIYYSFAFALTPLHEISHLIMAIIFGHKINKVALFQLNSSNTLGYVTHSWNKNSLYQSVGVFFIAVAPLIAATFITFIILENAGINVKHVELDLDSITYVLKRLSALEIAIISLVSFYCTPSNSDFKNSLKGLVYFGIFLGLYKLVTSYFDIGMQSIDSTASFFLGLTGIVSAFSSLFWIVLFVISLIEKAVVRGGNANS